MARREYRHRKVKVLTVRNYYPGTGWRVWIETYWTTIVKTGQWEATMKRR